MITLIRQELLGNLMTFRFAAFVFIMLLLVVAKPLCLLRITNNGWQVTTLQ